MDSMARSTTLGQRSYEDFVPSSEWLKGGTSDTLIVELPGFRKEHLKVQIDKDGNLRTSGERPLNGNRWRRFRKEFRVPADCNWSEIRAKFENGILSVTLPKLITVAEPEPEAEPAPLTQAPEPERKPETKPEPVTAKIENGEGIKEKIEDVVDEEKRKIGTNGLDVVTKMKRKYLLINVAVAAVIMIGVGMFIAYKFKKMAGTEIEEPADNDEF